jgi:DNA-binding NarL/FixJ family response regulator
MPKGATKYRRGKRERLILAGLRDGKTNPQIAAAMGLTHGTVRIYVSELMADLDARTRIGLVIVAMERGLVPGPRRPPAPAPALAPMRKRQNG